MQPSAVGVLQPAVYLLTHSTQVALLQLLKSPLSHLLACCCLAVPVSDMCLLRGCMQQVLRCSYALYAVCCCRVCGPTTSKSCHPSPLHLSRMSKSR